MGLHTATGEWQSFELRMRRRRAERLTLRAEVALDAGFPEDARGFLDEARRLAPNLRGLTAVQQRLDHPESVVAMDGGSPQVAAVSLRRRALPLAIGGAAAVVALVMAARPSPIAPVVDGRMFSLAVPDAVPRHVPLPPEVRSPASVSTAAQSMRRDGVDVPPLPDIAPARPGRDGETPDDWVAVARPVPASVTQLVPLPSVSRETAPIAAGSAALPVLDGIASTPPGATVSAGALPEVASLPADRAIRATLDRYAAASTSLAAAGAPRVSLGECRIDVLGPAAHADCSGTAIWLRIGEQSPRTEPRQWTFELTRAQAGWQILSARVQNR
jgi:hypothetical protein